MHTARRSACFHPPVIMRAAIPRKILIGAISCSLAWALAKMSKPKVMVGMTGFDQPGCHFWTEAFEEVNEFVQPEGGGCGSFCDVGVWSKVVG